jgi:hypothetical protein
MSSRRRGRLAREPDSDPAVANPDCLAERLTGDLPRFDSNLPLVHALERNYEDAMQDVEIAGKVRHDRAQLFFYSH